MKCAVVGHTEWTDFVLVDQVPAAGEIAAGLDAWAVPAGGGAVVAAQLARLTGACDFYTALGDDQPGRDAVSVLTSMGVTPHVEWRERTRRAITFVDRTGERTITTLGPKLRPAGPLPLGEFDTVFFVAGDVEALRSARAARFLAATPRELPTLLDANVPLDLLVGSATDPSERYDGGLDVKVVCATNGALGGIANGVEYAPAPLPGPAADTYGAGDSFAAALCFALARGDDLEDALALAARAGAAVVTGKGPFPAQITN